jgi:hypothetical protein
MSERIPNVFIEGKSVELLRGAYTNTGGLTAATLEFTIPREGNYQRFWNKEVTFYLSDHGAIPIFRGYIKRLKEDFNTITVYAQDALGYMVLGGNPEKAKIALTDDSNIDGLTVGAAIRKAINLANLQDKVGTDYIGDTTPVVSSSVKPLRGTLGVLDIIKTLIGRSVDNSVSPPKPNIARLVDDGTISQLIIELESDVDTGEIKHIFTEYDNITRLKIINRKIPTIIRVNGKGKVKGTFEHTSAIAAYDRNYLEVSNDDLKSPAECKDFAQKIFRANLGTQYEYGIDTFEGIHLNENDIIRVEAEDKLFSGNYRVRGKKIAFTSTGYDIGLNINRKPPTLAEYIVQQDN